jgi:hypothetical protein
MFWISIASVSAAAALIQLGALAVWVAVLKALLAVTAAIAMLLGLGHVWRSWHKDSSNDRHS